MLGLPDGISACLFDLDGVLTRTATVHAAAWKEMFDEYLRRRSDETGEPFVPFASRGIALPDGTGTDPPTVATVHGLGNRKNELVLAKMAVGVDVYSGSVRYAEAVRDAGLRRAVVSSSANTRSVLKTTGLEGLFEVVVDGLTAERENLAGKPAPEMFLFAARCLEVPAANAAVFEDALAGVEAGRAGRFGYVVGVDRTGQAEELRRHGAHVVVRDLEELLVPADRAPW
jgi:HAD superfamily hydrolase (TIGR01509 family)